MQKLHCYQGTMYQVPGVISNDLGLEDKHQEGQCQVPGGPKWVGKSIIEITLLDCERQSCKSFQARNNESFPFHNALCFFFHTLILLKPWFDGSGELGENNITNPAIPMEFHAGIPNNCLPLVLLKVQLLQMGHCFPSLKMASLKLLPGGGW